MNCTSTSARETLRKRWVATLLRFVPTVLLVFAPATRAAAFGGEDPAKGQPWYHEKLTDDACKNAGFSDAAAADVAWHADFLDSYLYNPLFWVEGGFSRVIVALATAHELEKLHFDDNTASIDVRASWKRYLSGTLAGLLWAASKNDVSAARNVLGVSLHAIQDFYSHSNWVDHKSRRDETYLETSRPERSKPWLYTGTYMLPDNIGHAVHGKVAPECLVVEQAAFLLDVACAGLSPLYSSSLCDVHRRCGESTAGSPASVLGVSVPAGALYYNPAGIALDSRWMSEIAARERGIDDVEGTVLFDRAYELALRSSIQWIESVGRELARQGHGAFWTQIRTARRFDGKREYEDFGRLPYQFISAGPYPTEEEETQWFLRVALETGTDFGAGTDADITLSAAGADFVLDYGRDAPRILNRNDFENGSTAVFTVGPFDQMPSEITLSNDTTHLGDVIEAAAHEFLVTVLDVLEAVVGLLKGMIGYHSDYIDDDSVLFSPARLLGIDGSGEALSLRIMSDEEGKYLLHGRIRRVASEVHENNTFQIQMTHLYCIEESTVDQPLGIWSDEPFFMFVATPAPGEPISGISGPWHGVDRNETRSLAMTLTVKVPDGGALAFMAQGRESDGETRRERTVLLQRITGEIRNNTEDSRRSLGDALAAWTAGDWNLHRIGVHAFTRGDEIRFGEVLDLTIRDWINGDTSRTFELDPRPPVIIPSLGVIDQVRNMRPAVFAALF